MRAVRPDRVPSSIVSYVMDELGREYMDSTPLELAKCFKDSSPHTPLVFVLSKGSDPTKDFFNLANQMRRCLTAVLIRPVHCLAMLQESSQSKLGAGSGPKGSQTHRARWHSLPHAHTSPPCHTHWQGSNAGAGCFFRTATCM
jgi:hypothetical protein